MKKVNIILAAFTMSFFLSSCQKEEIVPQSLSAETGTLKGLPAKTLDEVSPVTNNFKIHFEVIVHLSTEKSLCNAYMVELKDGNGRLIGDKQNYIPGISTYHFYDNSAGDGVRIARLILNPNIDHIVCPNELYTTPAILEGRFTPGSSYTFDLYPEDAPAKMAE